MGTGHLPCTLTFMKKFFLLISSSIFIIQLNAQKHDNVWMLGYGPTVDTFGVSGGITKVDFLDVNFPTKERIPQTQIGQYVSNSTISNEVGELQFYTNGQRIENHAFQVMENGDSIGNQPNWYFSGEPFPQITLALPLPDYQDRYVLFQMLWEGITLSNGDYEYIGNSLVFHEIDMSVNGGLGKVISRNDPVIGDTLDVGKITAVKHANGRDWWVLVWKYNSDSVYRILMGNNGVQFIGTQSVQAEWQGLTSHGQVAFSPDGTKYVTIKARALEGAWAEFYDFNRCTGMLARTHQHFLPDFINSPGIAISPNSRFAYVSATEKIYQVDLWGGNYEFVLLDEFDGYGQPFVSCAFYQLQLALDGKIYGSAPCSMPFLHVVEFPNKKAPACDFRQRGFGLPTLNCTTIPNHPNYRLGPLDGSPCDTLGLDNHPVAKYRYEQDTTDYLQVEFTDLSYYEPAEWSWDFGDNTTSQDTSPVHVFPQSGMYDVCLTVSNQYGGHTYCDSVYLEGTVSASIERQRLGIEVFPNPSGNIITVKLPSNIAANGSASVKDLNGKVVWEGKISNNTQIDVSELPPGIYFLTVTQEKGDTQTVKFIKH